MEKKQNKGKCSLWGRGWEVLTKGSSCRVASETQCRNQNFQAAAVAEALLGFSWRTESLCIMSRRAVKGKL